MNRLLSILYAHSKAAPYEYLEINDLADQLEVDGKELAFLSEHLDDKGLVDAQLYLGGGGLLRITPAGQLEVEERSGATPTHSSLSSTGSEDAADSRDPNRVFVIQGRNQRAARELKLFLQSLGLQEWTFDEVAVAEGNAASIFDIVHRGVSGTRAVIVLFTPDERAALQAQLAAPDDKPQDKVRWQARPNVIYEAGLARGLNPEGTILVSFGDVELPSDLAGIKIVKMENHPRRRKELRERLIKAGCSLNDSSGAWMTSEQGGDFDPSLVEPGSLYEQ